MSDKNALKYLTKLFLYLPVGFQVFGNPVLNSKLHLVRPLKA